MLLRGPKGGASRSTQDVYAAAVAALRIAGRVCDKGDPTRFRQDHPMTKLLLVRHGHVEGISPERFRGRAELKLTAAGRREAEMTAARIAVSWRPAAIYTSPMSR